MLLAKQSAGTGPQAYLQPHDKFGQERKQPTQRQASDSVCDDRSVRVGEDGLKSCVVVSLHTRGRGGVSALAPEPQTY